MKNKTLSKIIRCILFLLIAVLLFVAVSFALERKTNIAKMNEFYSLEKNSLDYICIGSSHAYCTVNPLEIWNQSGLRGFVLATQQQPLEASYHYVVEAFKTQAPKVVILEGYMAKNVLADADDGVLYDAIDPINFSSNKLDMIKNLIPEDQREAYLLNVLKYHTRWKELMANGAEVFFNQPVDIYKGYSVFNGNEPRRNHHSNYDSVKAIEIPEANVEMFDKILQVVKENNAKLILMIAPYEANVEAVAGIMKSEHEWADENGVEVIDYSLLLNELKIDSQTDYYDSTHLDVSGATKASCYLSDYLIKNGLKQSHSSMDEAYKRDYAQFVKDNPDR